ncbi:MAG: GAF domain-containing protein [Clostridia bacterium]|nr:GAF domain-containing protein [Clostridia bacterium]
MRNKRELPQAKRALYEYVIGQLNSLFEGSKNTLCNLANASSLLYYSLPQTNWTGFYLIKDNKLTLAPFIGEVACSHIDIGKGVCGKAVATNQTIVVDDVKQFVGHISCDTDSQAEIVIPLRVGQNVVGVLDLDSPYTHRFDSVDKDYLEQIAQIITHSCDWADNTLIDTDLLH